jgi:hypothetical protein
MQNNLGGKKEKDTRANASIVERWRRDDKAEFSHTSSFAIHGAAVGKDRPQDCHDWT